MTSVTLPAASSVKPCGWFIQEFAAITEKAPPTPEITIGTAAHKCGPRREPVPAVDVDGDEDRLQEEEDPLDREADPEDVAEAAHEPRPEQAELEGEDRAGDGADGEQHGDAVTRRRRTAGDAFDQLRKRRASGSFLLPPAVLGDQHHRREGDPEAGEDDVEARA